MAIGNNNIYPPIVTSFAPCFVIGSTKGCRVYFSISTYNSMEEYEDIHISITRQADNVSALNRSSYPSYIKIAPVSSILIDNTRESSDKYYIALKNDDIEGGFKAGVVYKVQMRFSSNKSNLYAVPQQLDTYLTQNLNSFSEWSQVCLVQGINQPTLKIKNGQGGYLSTNNTFKVETLEIVGTLITDDIDPLRQYELTLYDENNKVVETSGVLFPISQSSANQINYVFKHALQDGSSYNLKIHYMTYGLYEEDVVYPIFVLLDSIEQLSAHIKAIEDLENGRIGVNIVGETARTAFVGTITIRRTSSNSNFELWEDVHTVELQVNELNYTWYDYTIESGVWYKYCVQKRNAAGHRGIVTQMKEPVMLIFDDIFLNAEGTQIKIKFNPQISSFQRTVMDSKIDTIGSKYPYIKRNGATQYKQFPISGLISFLMDEDKIFASKEDYYDEQSLTLYNEYNYINRIDDINDIVYEKVFREKVMDFLYKHNVKLFRSATEGNILVKLMDITFTPNVTLGRRIYEFQCTAFEVADYTLANIDYYNIQKLNAPTNVGRVDIITEEKVGQWTGYLSNGLEFIHYDISGYDLDSVLEEYYQKDKKQGYKLSIPYVNYLRLHILDDAYMIYDNGDPVLYNGQTGSGSIYPGYIVYINEQKIVIPEDGIYELKGEDVEISSLYLYRSANVEIRYNAVIIQTEDTSKILSNTTYTTRIGQEWGAFNPGDSLYTTLRNKYYIEQSGKYYQALVSINEVSIEANPGTVVYVQEEGESQAMRHIIGTTARLDFYDEETAIADVYFMGAHFEQATESELERDILPEGKFNKTNIVVDNLDKIADPQERYVYFLEPTNITPLSDVEQAAVLAVEAPILVELSSAKGLPIFIAQKDGKNIAIVAHADLGTIQSYLQELGYEVYHTPTIGFENGEDIKIVTSLDGLSAFEIILNNVSNRMKLENYNRLLAQYGEDEITSTLKRQIWNDITGNMSDYYIYYNSNWYIFDEHTQDAVCPVTAIINYVCETIRGDYKI